MEDKNITFDGLLNEAENLYQKILNVPELNKEEKLAFINEICDLTFNLQKLKEIQKEKESNFKLILFRNIINSLLLTFVTCILFIFKYYMLFILGIIILSNRIHDYLIIKTYGINNYNGEINEITNVIDECTKELDKKERIVIQKVNDNIDLNKAQKIFEEYINEKNIVSAINAIDNKEVYDNLVMLLQSNLETNENNLIKLLLMVKNPEYEENRKLLLMK